MGNLKIKGKNPIETNQRLEALESIQKLDTSELLKLKKLAESDTARSFLTDNWDMLESLTNQ
ncbi:MAG: hypothetical protein HRT68_10210 [Flavobacteriaceae bacterium]|nr:hypothetical protein [Flavobacteriaceae bacterium]